MDDLENARKLGWIIPDWPAPDNVRAVCTTRQGGVSEAPFDALNLGGHVGDDPVAVAGNRELLSDVLPFSGELLWLDQVHGVAVFKKPPDNRPSEQSRKSQIPSVSPGPRLQNKTCESKGSALQKNPGVVEGAAPLLHTFYKNVAQGEREELSAEAIPRADASAVFDTQQVSVIMTADCLPVLFCNRQGTRVASAHAGWRGLCNGVLEATITSLAGDPADLMAWLGPAIGPDAFEVGAEVRTAFMEHDIQAEAAFKSGAEPGKYLADIYELARQRLKVAGVSQVYGGDYCTVSDPERFFSYRREARTGRMASLIWMQ